MTKAEYFAIVDKYDMKEFLDNEVTQEVIGHYVVTDGYIDELDQMMENSWPNGNVSVERLSFPLNEVVYRLFPPKNWLRF